MGGFKAFGEREPFVQLEKPFLLIFESRDGGASVAWFHTEENLVECVDEVKRYGCSIVAAIEIGNCRYINIGE